MNPETEKKDKRIAGLVTGILHIALLLIFIFVQAFSMPDPPPGEKVVEISMADYGNTATGSGDTETEVPSQQREEVVEEQVSETPQTQESVPTDAIETQADSEISAPTSTEDTETEEEPEEEEPKVSSDLSNALNQMNQGGGGGDGDDSETGNEGNQEGNIEGSGVVGGKNGVSFSLSGRGMIGEPAGVKPTEEGKVVLDIYVDKQGKITRHKRNYEKSNTASDYLFSLAEQALKTVTFDTKGNAPPVQKGTITFNFKLE
ncbi:energy transducer TonB family protein [Halocola ammonii]